jgi:RimJ/RimL family protein N-acetyltransferase
MNTEVPRALLPLFEELQGERVAIRPYQEDDTQVLFEAIVESRDHLRPWQPWIANAHQTIEESRDVVVSWVTQWARRERLIVGIWNRLSGDYLGSCGLHPKNWRSGYFEIRYWLRASALGQGYMTEAVKLLTDYALTRLQATRLEIRCEEHNQRSAAVARRLGFVQEGRLRNMPMAQTDDLCTLLLFALTPADRQVL